MRISEEPTSDALGWRRRLIGEEGEKARNVIKKPNRIFMFLLRALVCRIKYPQATISPNNVPREAPTTTAASSSKVQPKKNSLCHLFLAVVKNVKATGNTRMRFTPK